MKTFRMLGMALVAVMFGFAMSSCNSDDDDYQITYEDPYKDYPQLIVGKWFNFTPEESVFMNFNHDKTFSVIGYDENNVLGWMNWSGTYRVDGNKLIYSLMDEDNPSEVSDVIEVTSDMFLCKAGSNSNFPELENRVHYRVKEQFDIKGNYTYLNSVARVVPAEGKTALQLPEGVTFNGQNSISIDAMHGDRIINAMKDFFADATFADGGKLNHTMNGESKVKNYTLEGNNLTFDLYEGGAYKVNAMSFPDEDGDRLFIIIPKQAAWLGGMVDLVEKENAGLKLDAAQIAALEAEFMDTFETFTVILSLSKK